MKLKYTKEVLQAGVDASEYWHELYTLFEVRSGSAQANVRKRLLENNIDTSGLKFRRAAYGGGNKLTPEAVFGKVVRGKGHQLSRALIESGVEYRCVLCDLGDTWNGNKITLQVDHINGNNSDNRMANLRFLCPNCHSQTETWGTKKRDGG